jgi:hypothetical protein
VRLSYRVTFVEEVTRKLEEFSGLKWMQLGAPSKCSSAVTA